MHADPRAACGRGRVGTLVAVTETGIDSTVETEPSPLEPPAPRPRPGVPFLPAIFLAAALLFFGVVAGTWWANREATPGPVDVGFYDDMTTHHLQAIKMANIYERNGTNDDLRSRALEIEFEQTGDVRVMQDALATWNKTGSPDVAMEWMGTPVPTDQMPGLATPQELTQLEAARGLQLDDLFSRLMIQHHAGGIHMAAHAAASARLGKVRDLATAMAQNQQREIDELNHVRQSLGLPVVAANSQ
jgi:uncharacterized protein (DUF305 family)